MAIGLLYTCFIDVAREQGADVERALRDVGLSQAALRDPSTRLTPEVGRAFCTALFRDAKLPTIGLEAARRFQFSDFDLFGYLMKYAHDFGSMIEAASRYGRLLGDTADFSVERQKDEVVLALGRSGGRTLLYEASDFAAAVLALHVRELIGPEVLPLQVQLPRARPDDVRPYERFFRCAVTFGAERATLVYPASALALPCRFAEPRLSGILRRHAEEQLAKLPPDAGLVLRVRTRLAARLSDGEADLGEVARSLAMSERTLRRRLREAGTGYRELLDEVRRERALILADQGAHTATEIALLVGFEDVAAFARAFRRWTGILPRDYLAGRRPSLPATRASEAETGALSRAR